MIWFYTRQGAFIRCETRDADGDAAYELLIIEPDGTERVERFNDSAALNRRQQELEARLADDGWQGPFGRTI